MLPFRPSRGLAPFTAAVAFVLVGPRPSPAQEGRLGDPGPEPPRVRFHVGSEELVPLVYPDRYAGDPERIEEDAEWTADRAEDLLERWEGTGALLLQRIADYAGFDWTVRDIEVHLVRYWPVISIERPLVLAIGSIRSGGREVAIPDDEDFLALVLAHQLTHWLLEPPERVAGGRNAVLDHPFLQPGNFEIEAMVNWVVYRALEDLWGRERLARATGHDLWRAYNPNHDYVMDELMTRASLSRTRPLRAWLAENPRGSEIFRVRDAYRRETESRIPAPVQARERRTGTDYGLDLGASYDGRVFVAFVDEGSPAHRAGVQQGDVVLTVEGRPVEGVVEARRRIDESWEENGEINLSVSRGDRETFLTIERR